MTILIAIITGGVASAIVSGVFSLILSERNRKAAKEEKEENKNDDITCGVRMLLYDRIKHLGKNYITRGEIHTEELEDLIAMHKVYHDKLGGNGFLDSLMHQVERLPIVE